MRSPRLTDAQNRDASKVRRQILIGLPMQDGLGFRISALELTGLCVAPRQAARMSPPTRQLPFGRQLSATYLAVDKITTGKVWSAAGLQGKRFGREDKSAAMYSAFEWRSFLLAMMSPAAYLSLQVGRSLETIIGIRLKARRCDCSLVLVVPVQTSVGKLQIR